MTVARRFGSCGQDVTTEIALASIVWDPKIYPRAKWSTATIERYADAIEAGDRFPPLILEQGTNRLLDGKHRFEAYKRAEVSSAAIEWHAVPEGMPVKLYAASLSARHGDRMTNSDLKTLIREVYQQNPEFKQADVVRLLGVSKQWVSANTSDILAKRREERRAKVLRLEMLGWTHAEIAARLDVSRQTVDLDAKESTDGLIGSGHSPEEIALRLGWPVQLVHAVQLDGADDSKRMDRLGIKIQPYDVWQFAGCHDLMGDSHPGRIPGELVAHVLYFYTKPGDLVIDPMAGSGTTLDACLLMGRRARSYDIDLHHERIDVETHDLHSGWPAAVSKASLVFWDPPYFSKMDGGYVNGSISGLAAAEYLEFFAKRFAELHAAVRPGTVLAFLMSDYDDSGSGIFLWDYADLLRAAGWRLTRQIQCPLPTQQVHPDIVTKFRQSRRLARLERYLLVCEA